MLINSENINKVVASNEQKLEKYEYAVSNKKIEIYFDEENWSLSWIKLWKNLFWWFLQWNF